MTSAYVELSTRAIKDLRRLDPSLRARAETFIQRRLRAVPQLPNLDIRSLEGKPPWLRARVGELRIICRRLTSAELTARQVTVAQGYLIVRIVPRRELERAVSEL